MKKLLISSFIAAIGLVGAFGAQPANAASAYDEAWIQTDELVLFANNAYGLTCEAEDVTLSWSEAIQAKTTQWESFSEALDTGSWAVVYSNNKNDTSLDATMIEVYWSETQQMEMDFTLLGGTFPSTSLSVDTGYINKVTISQDYAGYEGGQDCGVNSPNALYDADSTSTWNGVTCECTKSNSYGADVYGYLAANVIVNYPEDYEGPEIPEEAPGGVVTSDYVPDFKVMGVVNYVAEISDQNFNTFDGIEWTCSEDGNSLVEGGEGFAPVLYWQLWYDGDEPDRLISDGYQSSTAPLSIEMPQIGEEREYRLAGWYECGGTVDFTDAANISFTVSAQGMLVDLDRYGACFSTDFPFIDLEACVNNLAMFASMATMGDLAWGNNWSSGTGCHTFTTFDDWLHLDNPTVCPVIPNEIRAIITPFITFSLGLIIVKWISRQGKDF